MNKNVFTPGIACFSKGNEFGPDLENYARFAAFLPDKAPVKGKKTGKKMSLRRAEPCGIFNVDLCWNGGSFVRKFIIPSGLITVFRMFCVVSAGAELRGIKPDFRINCKYLRKSCFTLLYTLLITACSFSYDTYPQNDDEPNLVMKNAEYVRITNGNPEIRVNAKEIRHYEAKHTMELDNFSFEQYNAAPEGQVKIPDINARGKADLAHMETDTGNFYLKGDVALEVVSEDFSMKTAEITWQDNERLLNAPGSVNLKRSNGTVIQGTGFSADVRSRNWEFESMVEGSIVEDNDDDNN